MPETVSLHVVSKVWYDNVVCVSADSKVYSHARGLKRRLPDRRFKDYAAVVEDEKYEVVVTAAGKASFFWHEWDKPKMPTDRD